MITLVIWQFYDETAISSKWSIRRKDFLFYFLFSVVIIPFQIIIDVLFYNIMTFYLDYDFINSLRKWESDFQTRGKSHFWRGFSPFKIDLEQKLRTLEQMSFSSQYYFMSYLGVAGMLFVIVGVMIILETKANPYGDVLFFPLLIFNQLIIFFVEYVSKGLRKKFKIWEFKEIKKNENAKESEPKTTESKNKNKNEKEISNEVKTAESKKRKGTILGKSLTTPSEAPQILETSPYDKFKK